MLTDLQIEQAVAAFVTFFVLIDAPGVAPIFASLTAPGGELTWTGTAPAGGTGFYRVVQLGE